MTDHHSLPEPVERSVDSWLARHDDLAPGVIEGLYLIGSVALDDWQSSSDIDIVAFTADPTDSGVVSQLEAAHVAYRTQSALPTVDGPILAWADVTSPPLSAQRSWTLDGEFRFDGECFEINPVTWYTLARYGVAVRGPAAADLDVHLDETDRTSWVRENVDTYWRGIGEQIGEVLESDPERQEFGAAMQEWCALGIARMAYTFETGDITSKSGAGNWAIGAIPEFADVMRGALDIRHGTGPESVDRVAVERLVTFMLAVVATITDR